MIPFTAQPVMIAQVQCNGDFALAKLVKQGTSSVPVAGSGTVKVQVQVNADGTHKAIKVISSTNPADNDAAMDLAQNSSYKPAMCGSKPQPSFYDFNMKFNGKAASNSASAGSNGPIEAAIRAGHYDEAISKANASLLASPGNDSVMQLLGVAQYYDAVQKKQGTGDAAQTFSRIGNLKANPAHISNFAHIAADAFASAAAQMAQSNPSDAMTYAQKAVEIENSTNSQFSLGVAQSANQQYAAAVTTLQGVRAKVTPTDVKLAVDRQLLSAALSANNDAVVSSTAADMKGLDPTGQAAATAIAAHYISVGQAAMTAKTFPDAEKAFDKAIGSGVTGAVLVTAQTEAAFAELSMPKPDFKKAAAYAETAVAGNPNSPEANYAAGVSYGSLYGTSKSAGDKTKALGFLNKADSLAKAAGNAGLQIQIESQIKIINQ